MRSLFVALLSLLFAVSAQAVTLSYSGVIDFVDDPSNLLASEVTLGAPFTVDVEFDETTAVLDSVIAGIGTYVVTPPPVVTLLVGGTTLVNHSDYIGIAFDHPTGLDFWSTTNGFAMGEDPEVNFNLGYVDTSGTLLADATFFVPSDTDFTGWDSVALGFSYWDGMGFITLATGSIDVPESVPATSPLGQLVVVSLLIGATAHYFSRQRQSS